MVGTADHRIPVQPEPFDLATAAEAQARALHDLAGCVHLEMNPDMPVPPLEHYQRLAANLSFFERRSEWAVWDGPRMAGWGRLEIEDTESNRDQARFRIEVDPAARRRGIARRLLAEISATARRESRTTLGGTSRAGTAGERFLSAVGAEKRQEFRISRMETAAVDRAMLRSWVDRAAERAGGYSLVGWDDPCPEERLEGFTDVVHVMNTAPLDDLEREDDVWTVEQIRDWQAALTKQGHAGWVFCAKDDGTGRFVGFTELGFWGWAPAFAFQGDTGVHPDHRNRGLGRWLKAGMALRLLDERPEVEIVETGNASSNAAMLAINEAMGFRAHNYGSFWQMRI